jgi:hypothetical protein
MFKWKPDHEMASMLFDKAGMNPLSPSLSLPVTLPPTRPCPGR